MSEKEISLTKPTDGRLVAIGSNQPMTIITFNDNEKTVASINLETGEIKTDLPVDEAGKESARIFFESFGHNLINQVKNHKGGQSA